MGRYSEQINSLSSYRTQINSALSDKLSDTVDVKFSEMADKIREIEASTADSVIIYLLLNNAEFYNPNIDIGGKTQQVLASDKQPSGEYKIVFKNIPEGQQKVTMMFSSKMSGLDHWVLLGKHDDYDFTHDFASDRKDLTTNDNKTFYYTLNITKGEICEVTFNFRPSSGPE